MPWMRSGDNAATYPKLMQTAGQRSADERTVNEVAGWLWRCATQSAAHLTDYRIDMGTALMLGGSRTTELIRLCTKSGLLTQVTVDGMRYLQLIEDPEFIHIRLKAEVEWERQQRKDTRDPKLRAPVLHRDGDNCRYCGVMVVWRGPTSNRTGTLDHLVPGQAGAIASMVVACKGCNGARQDNPQWDDDHPRRSAPARPLYGRITAEYLSKHGYPVEPNVTAQERPATAVATDTAPHDVRPVSSPPADPAPAAGDPGVSAKVSEACSDELRLAGSGRVGTDSGRDGDPPPALGETSDHPPPRKRRRRGRRGKPSPHHQPQTNPGAGS